MPRLSKIGAAALGAFGWTSGSSISASYLVVAGGGGGGATRGGGGGAGGLLSGTTSLNPTLSYTVTVGAGGAGASASVGASGANSVFNAINATGGGGGAWQSTSTGVSGGSGGGGAYSSGSGGSGTSGQGFSGGSGSVSVTVSAGGGGGAGAVGANGVGGVSGGAGGVGVSSSISGTATFYAGGGGGSSETVAGGAGGNGGGGAGATNASTNAVSGTASTGGGGGGGYPNTGGNGGSGVVIISYLGAQQFGGGVVTSSGGYTIHTFNTSGTLAPLSSLTASYLIVAGGGSGGYDLSGGGGAGGLLSGSGLTIDTNSTYLVTVGAGAVGVTSGSGNSGSSSAFSMVSTSASGGGGGGRYAINGVAGASGGGAGGDNANAGPFTGGSATPSGQGNAGGGSNKGATTGGGGGGGSGGTGGTGTTSTGGAGGIGSTSSISGTSTYYAGGGGGGGYSPSSIAAGAGGLGGGGAGGATTNQVGTAGTANTGGGGGGTAGGGGASTSAAGGSGIVIISYAGVTQQMAGGTVTISGGNVIHTFTSSGYLTPLKFVGNSLRFRSSASAYLNRTPTTAGNLQKWTWSSWVKRGALSYGESTLFNAGTTGIGTNDTGFLGIRFTVNDQLDITTGLTDLRLTTQVFRDPAAWYHIVVAFDTTQTTGANRVKVYVNGTQVTAYSGTDPSLNLNTAVNNTYLHEIARTSWNSAGYFNGYQTEVNLIDGQALTPNSFGTFNSYGVWQPITYGGSYGTNGFYLPFTVDKTQYSYAFNTTPSYLTSSTAGLMPLGNTTWSIECWVWCNVVPTSNVAFIQNTASGGIQIFYKPSINTVEIGAYGVADVLPATTTVNNLLLNAWNHFVFTSNGTQLRIFANGILIGYLSSSYSFAASQSTVRIGTNDTTAAQTLDGFISNLRVCNGSIPTTYQTSSTTIGASIFTPPTTALTTTSQGAANVSLLTCQSSTIIDNSSSPKTLSMTGTVTPSNIGCSSNPFYDRSPVGNNWTPNNISLINGSTCDSMTDVPTLTSATVANYCTLNPLASNTTTAPTQGNLYFGTNVSNNYSCVATMGVSSGKWYWEWKPDSAYSIIGITSLSFLPANIAPTTAGSLAKAYYAGNGQKYDNGSNAVYGATFSSANLMGIALDMNAGTITFYKDNVSQGTAYTGLSGVYFPIIGGANAYNAGYINFGQQPFTYTAPSGFLALNTYNL